MWKWDDWVEDPEIGKMKFVLKTWDEGNTNLHFKELKQTKFIPKDFGISSTCDVETADLDVPEARMTDYGFYPLK